MRPWIHLLSGLVLSLTLACGGSSHSDLGPAPPAAPVGTPAAGFQYTSPTGTGWRLVQDATSTPQRIILDLIGPAGTLSRGVGFNLQAPKGVRFGTFTGSGFPINDTGVYELLSVYSTYPLEPMLLAAGVKPGNLLTAGIFQKDRRLGAKDSGSPLCQIALEFDAKAGLVQGDALVLTVPKAKFIAGDIGASEAFPNFANDTEFFDAQTKSVLTPIGIAVGTLVAQ